ncbi:pyrimidine/purine nucleoside phosphorylase [Psychrobacter sp. HD31]|uniref:pyrimidine/purine nucleoside phosphorylase n=1 Tax=Psychrobacter sp. HD31 TaxID=3112003 RepID=UPI003DA57968
MSVAEFTNVSVVSKANVSYDGRCSSHTLLFEDGSKKMLGVVSPNDETVNEYHFATHTSERMEIISGECEVKIEGEETFNKYRAGQSFMVAGDSGFELRTNQILQYICHLER